MGNRLTFEGPPFAGGLSAWMTSRNGSPISIAPFGPMLLLATAGILSGCAGSPVAPAKPFLSCEAVSPNHPTVVFIGDTQQTSHWEFWRERNDDKTIRLLEEIARRRPAFIVNLGDLTTRGSSAPHWAWFDAAHRPIREARIPYFPILGNHDYYARNTTSLKFLRQRFPLLRKNTWYDFTHDGVGFILLNSNFADLPRSEKSRQQEWYLATLDRMDNDSTIRWIIVASHHPPYTNSRVVRPSAEVRREFAEPFTQSAKGALFLSGHCHSYERFEEGGKTFVVSGGGGGPRHGLKIDPGTRRFADRFPGPSLRFFHFCEMTIGRESLEVEVVRLTDEGTFETADRIILAGR